MSDPGLNLFCNIGSNFADSNGSIVYSGILKFVLFELLFIEALIVYLTFTNLRLFISVGPLHRSLPDLSNCLLFFV
ncbi:hypothetical protein BpHYR1_022681 [Brachionus plicatilis]|uniref:Uncharacterized protein n=1 Tax=Brachionus plicatilis TaxID=10195 RepID=A0A3M7SJA0_BRAPC|nr:hypothetical protein BpHYR1_022681 [Brachionus plicatilis]